MSKIENLEKLFEAAKKENQDIAIELTVPGRKERETIIVRNANLAFKLKYYKENYNESLKLNKYSAIEIVNAYMIKYDKLIYNNIENFVIGIDMAEGQSRNIVSEENRIIPSESLLLDKTVHKGLYTIKTETEDEINNSMDLYAAIDEALEVLNSKEILEEVVKNNKTNYSVSCGRYSIKMKIEAEG